MPMSMVPNRGQGQQCYIMVGDMISYEPAWDSPKKKKLLLDAGVGNSIGNLKDSIGGATTAGLGDKSLIQIKKSKRSQKKGNTI